MQKTNIAVYAFGVLLLGAVFLTGSSAQIRIRLPRPTIPKAVTPQQTQPSESERGADLQNTATAQANKSAIEYDSLMNMRFYEQTGGFLVENLEVVFPGTGAATF